MNSSFALVSVADQILPVAGAGVLSGVRPGLQEPLSHWSSGTSDAAADVLAGKRAVVVEDEGITQLQLQRILKAEGVQLAGVAANGLEAIERVRETRPDFVLMDISMPEMDGMEAARRILAERRVCIVLLTAYSDQEHLREAREMGIAGYILKPITSTTLVPNLILALQAFCEV